MKIYNPKAEKCVEATPEMVFLRKKLSEGMGYVLRKCSLGGDFECWENKELTHNYEGTMVSTFHCVHHFKDELYFPNDVQDAAYKIDKCKPEKNLSVSKNEQVPPMEKENDMFGEGAAV